MKPPTQVTPEKDYQIRSGRATGRSTMPKSKERSSSRAQRSASRKQLNRSLNSQVSLSDEGQSIGSVDPEQAEQGKLSKRVSKLNNM